MLDIAHTRQLITDYAPHGNDDRVFQQSFLSFLGNVDAITGKGNDGVLSAAAWVIDPTARKVLLLRNDFLELWLNPGGKYNEGDGKPELTMARELSEEAGITLQSPLTARLFDIDVIGTDYNPNLKKPMYDMRFLVEADSTAPLGPHEEDKQPRWYDYNDVVKMVLNDIRNERMLRRTEAIFGLT